MWQAPHRRNWKHTLELKGCLDGVVSTFAALEVFYVSAAALLALWRHSFPTVQARLNSFIEFLITIQNYGLDPIAFSIPFDLL